MAITTSQHPTYSRAQLERYISHIYQLPLEEAGPHLTRLEEAIRRGPLAVLTELQRRHLSIMPFGNVVLHYSQHRTISLDHDLLFHKLVERGLGGYCVENTGLFAIVLRSLGFQIYTGGAKVSRDLGEGPVTRRFHGLGHMVIFVSIGEDRYMVDVGFGPKGPTRPMLMKDGHVSIAVAPEEGRLIKGNIPASADRDQTFWIYQYGSSAKNEWSTAYAFSETEFFREDYDVMNFYTSQHPTSSFVQGFIVSRFLLSEEKDDIIGWLMIGKDLVKRNIKGQVEVVQTLASEEERVDALDKLFNMHLEPMEIRGIQSLRTELGAQ